MSNSHFVGVYMVARTALYWCLNAVVGMSKALAMRLLLDATRTERVIGLAIAVHRHLGPGLLESVYEEALCFELAATAIPFARQVPVPVIYRGQQIAAGFRADLIVDDALRRFVLSAHLRSADRATATHATAGS